MALLAIEGFELYGTGAHAARRLTMPDVTGWSIVAGRGEVGKAFRYSGSAFVRSMGLIAIASTDTVVLGFAIRSAGWTAAASTIAGKICLFTNTSNAGFGTLYVTNEGFLRYSRTTNVWTATVTNIAESTNMLPINAWVFVEVRIRFHNSAGTIDYRMNGLPTGSFTGLNTSNATTNFLLGLVNFGNVPGGSSTEVIYDDIYVLDSSGTRLNGFLGDTRVMRAALVGEQQAQWGRNTGASNLAAINDAAPDDDATYTHSNTAGQRDLYNVGALSAAEIHAVDIRSLQRKEDAGSGAIRLVGRVGTDESLSPLLGVGANYEYRNHLLTVNPATGLPFTAAELADLAIGYELAST